MAIRHGHVSRVNIFLHEISFQDFFNVFLFCRVHDRKMCALGLCTLLELVPQRPHDVAQISHRLLPSCCNIFENLEKVYQGFLFVT